jgi:hypothetical protein
LGSHPTDRALDSGIYRWHHVSSHATVMHCMRIVSFVVSAQSIHNTRADLTAHGVVDETQLPEEQYR